MSVPAAETVFDRSYPLPPEEALERLRKTAIEHDQAIRARRLDRNTPAFSTDGGAGALRINLGFAALTGAIEAAPDGCRLRGHLGLHPNFKTARPIVLVVFLLLFGRSLLPSALGGSGGLVGALVYGPVFAGLLYFAFVHIPRQAAAQSAELLRLVGVALGEGRA
jgi:hypothetical protein